MDIIHASVPHDNLYCEAGKEIALIVRACKIGDVENGVTSIEINRSPPSGTLFE